jgi:hypothetical protein
MNGISCQLFLYCLSAYTFFKFKRTLSFEVDKNWFQRVEITQISYVEST